MIILIASEAANIELAIAGEIVNFAYGKEYFRDGVMVDYEGKPIPAVGFTIGNRVYNESAVFCDHENTCLISVCGKEDIAKIKAYIPRLIEQMTNKYGIISVVRKMDHSVITMIPASLTKIYVSRTTEECVVRYMISKPTILVLASRNATIYAHRERIPSVDENMLTVYANSIKCDKILRLCVNQPLSVVVSDFWHCNFPNFSKFERIVRLIDVPVDDYLHPVEYWPADSTTPQFRTDICTACKSRLFGDNYAAYFHGTCTLHAFCPICTHYGLIDEHATLFKFTYGVSAADLLNSFIDKFPPKMHAFLRAASKAQRIINGIIKGDDRVYEVRAEQWISDLDIVDRTVVYGRIKMIA